MDLGLGDRTYIVTGGSRGLGYAVAEVLVDEGANVVVASRTEDMVRKAAEQLGERAHGVAADLRDPATPARLVGVARKEFDGLHGAFVSHGGPRLGPALDLEDETLRESLDMATVAPIRLVREVARNVPEGGAIAVLTSWSSVEPVPGLATSNVARPATWGYVKTLASEVGPQGVRVNVVMCGRFATDRQMELLDNVAQQRETTLEAVREGVVKDIPLRRMGEPPELGRVAAFLLSPAASYVTGTAWLIDGGLVRGL